MRVQWPGYEMSQAAAAVGGGGLAAVPVGGGRARAGLEIDHSEPSGSRVAISRAGRRPPAHTAAGPHKATQEPLHGIAKGAGISRPLWASALTHP